MLFWVGTVGGRAENRNDDHTRLKLGLPPNFRSIYPYPSMTADLTSSITFILFGVLLVWVANFIRTVRFTVNKLLHTTYRVLVVHAYTSLICNQETSNAVALMPEEVRCFAT